MDVDWSFLGLFIIFSSSSLVDVDCVSVKIAQGWLQGELLNTVTGDCQYYSFKGIPYAHPPLGCLRFKAPQPPLPWTGIRDAKHHGSICPQIDIVTHALIPGNEDCLFLNVYTPTLNPKKLLSVLFFIHGGAYKSGSGNIDKFGPDFLMSHEIVVVTINYRFDALGFLCLNIPEVPGNAGLKDQVAALKWVKNNINKFGGDPNKVTIMGQSAGGASVTLHLLSPMSAGLFQRAVDLTGAPNHNFAIPYQPQLRPYILGKQLGLATNDPKKLLQFLQSLPVEKLVNTYPAVLATEESTRNNIFKNYLFTPVAEKNFGSDHFLTQTAEQYALQGIVNKADLLIGHTDEETIFLAETFVTSYLSAYDRYPEMLVPRKILISSPPNTILAVSKMIRHHYFGNKTIDVNVIQEFITYANEANFIYDIHTYFNSLPNPYQNSRYFYLFSLVSERNFYGKMGAKYGLHGASHYDDLLYIFEANALNMTLYKNSKEYYLIQFVTKLLTNFVKYGNPTPDYYGGVLWPQYNNISKQYYHVTEQPMVKSNPDGTAVAFWKKIYNFAGIS